MDSGVAGCQVKAEPPDIQVTVPTSVSVLLLDESNNISQAQVILDESNSISQAQVILDDNTTQISQAQVILDDPASHIPRGQVLLDEASTQISQAQIILEDTSTHVSQGQVILDDCSTTISETHIILEDRPTSVSQGKVLLKDASGQIMLEEPSSQTQVILEEASTQVLLEESTLQSSSEPTAQFVCTICGKSLRDPHTLKCHVKTVHGEKKFSCPTCNKKFPHRGALNAHVKTHSGATFTCNICNESIKDSSYFKKHVRSHTEARSHQCPVCHKTYIQKSHLTVHMSIHSDHKPYKCDVCSKSFRLAKAYKEHKNMHDNIRNLKCPHCSYSSCYQKNLQAHVRNHAKAKIAKSKNPQNTSTEKNRLVETTTKEALISKPATTVCMSGQDPLGEMESPVYLLVNLESEENLATGIHDMETLNPLEMAQELCITSSQPDKLDEDYRPLDLSIVAPQENGMKQYHHDHQNQNIFCQDGGNPANTANFTSETDSSFENLSSLDPGYAANRSETGSPSDLAANQYLNYQSENPGRRRSVFLAEQLDYEHQGEMRVVDPAEVTG